jgi:DNA-binding HxlR family transcriptional regulator
MATTRTYGDRCGIARALDAVGERWALLLVRELLLGPKRFTDLRGGLPNASPNVISERLRELDRAGIVGRRKLGPPSRAQVYELTERGRELEPVVLALGRWGSAAPVPDDAEMSVDSHVIALKTVFEPGSPGAVDATYELRLEEDRFRVEVAGGRLEIVRGEAERPEATIATDRETLRALLWRGRDLDAAVRAGEATVGGERAAAARFLALFPAPAPAEGPRG